MITLKELDTLTTQGLDLKSMIARKEEELRNTPEYQDLQKLKKAEKEASLKRIEEEEAIVNSMLDANLKSFDTLDGRRLLIKKSPGSCKITNEELVDEEYRKEKTTKSIDKKAILSQLREGKHVDGAVIDYKFTLQIKRGA